MKKNPEIYDINFDKKYLFLNCPKCKEIPYLSFNKENPEKINIKCDKCNNKSEFALDKYISNLPSQDLLKNKNCTEHNNFLDKYCYKCHIQFCSKCEIYNQHSSHRLKTIKKIITLEKIEKAKNVLDENKNYLKKYIFDFINEYINKFPKNRHYYIINNLIKPYINYMKIFFHFCDCVLFNYDIEYPNYYQQCNLNNLLYHLKEKKSLLNLNEPKLEKIFKYNNNNFLIKKEEINNLISNDCLYFPNDKIKRTLLINDEVIVISFKNNINVLKLYNYKNNNLISTIETNFTDIEPSDKIKLKQINKDIFAVILCIERYLSKIKIYSIYSNTIVLFEKEFDFHVCSIRKINNNSFGIALFGHIEIYKNNENFENISEMIKSKNNLTSKFQICTNLKIQMLCDFVQTSNKLYIIALCLNAIIIYKNSDFSIFKEIKLKEEFMSINQLDDDNFILGPKILGIFNINEDSYKILYNDNIPELKMSYLSGTANFIDYSNFILTYFNKLICRRKFKQILKCHYDDVDDEVITDEKSLCIFDFNPEMNSINLIQNHKNIKIKDIYINNNNEIIISSENKIKIYYIE